MSTIAKIPLPLPDLQNPLNIDYVMLKKSSMVLRALNHKLRQQIIQIIANNEESNVTDLYVKLRVEQSVASQHLAILRKVHILTTTRKGKMVMYKINHDRITSIKSFVKDLLN